MPRRAWPGSADRDGQAAARTAAALAAAAGPTRWQLLIARAVQGLGAAVLASSTLTIVTSAVPNGTARMRAIATWSAVGAGGGAAGGLVGGALVDGVSWRRVLLINVPVGAMVLAGSLRWLTESRNGDGRRLDLPGAVLVTAGFATLAYGISQSDSEGWTATSTLLPLVAGLALIAAFLLVEARTAAPLMPLGLLRLRSVSSANVAMFLNGTAVFCMWFFVTLYAQNVLGYTPLQAGLAQVPSSLTVAGAGATEPGGNRRGGGGGGLFPAVRDDFQGGLSHRHRTAGNPDDAGAVYWDSRSCRRSRRPVREAAATLAR